MAAGPTATSWRATATTSASSRTRSATGCAVDPVQRGARPHRDPGTSRGADAPGRPCCSTLLRASAPPLPRPRAGGSRALRAAAACGRIGTANYVTPSSARRSGDPARRRSPASSGGCRAQPRLPPTHSSGSAPTRGHEAPSARARAASVTAGRRVDRRSPTRSTSSASTTTTRLRARLAVADQPGLWTFPWVGGARTGEQTTGYGWAIDPDGLGRCSSRLRTRTGPPSPVVRHRGWGRLPGRGHRRAGCIEARAGSRYCHASPPSGPPLPVTRALTSMATSPGRCSTTSSGRRASSHGSGSCTSTTTPRCGPSRTPATGSPTSWADPPHPDGSDGPRVDAA